MKHNLSEICRLETEIYNKTVDKIHEVEEKYLMSAIDSYMDVNGHFCIKNAKDLICKRWHKHDPLGTYDLHLYLKGDTVLLKLESGLGAVKVLSIYVPPTQLDTNDYDSMTVEVLRLDVMPKFL